MDPSALSWPARRPSHGDVTLRAYESRDVAMVRDLATDPYVPLIGTLPAGADDDEALDYIARQQRRLADGAGFSFAIADAGSDEALGGIGLWLPDSGHGRGSIGCFVAPRARGRAVAAHAMIAVTGFAWILPEVFRLEAFIEPSNRASVRNAETAGFRYEGLLRSYMTIGERRRDMAVYARLRND